LTDIWA